MHAISFTDARANFNSVLDRVVADRAPVVITRQRGEAVVLISQREWDSIEETMYLLSSPNNAERLLKAVRGLEAGEGVEHDLIEP